jgi:hypothetical protein
MRGCKNPGTSCWTSYKKAAINSPIVFDQPHGLIGRAEAEAILDFYGVSACQIKEKNASGRIG